MAVKRYIPIHLAQERSDYASLIQLQRDIDKAFRAVGLPAATEKPGDHTLMRSRVGIVKTDHSYVITVEVAGVVEDRIKLALMNNTLILKGEKEQRTAYNDQEFHLTEHSYSSFERRLSLPADIDQEHIEAHFKDGTLVINLARRSSATSPKPIYIRKSI